MKEYTFFITESDNDSNGPVQDKITVFAETDREAWDRAEEQAEARFHGIRYKLDIAPDVDDEEEPPEQN